MPDPVRLEKAELIEIDADQFVINPDKRTKVQFNPETLKVSFSNQLKTPDGGGDQTGTAARQFVGAGVTKLSLQLWFDVTAPARDLPEVNDVRKLTSRVAYFITPREVSKGSKKMVPPIVRFIWGSFQFDGMMDALEESLEMFSPDGRPLRAGVTLSLSQQRIQFMFFDEKKSLQMRRMGKAGTRPMAQASSGSTVQKMASDAGRPDDWQSIAAANGIENPRRLEPGQLVNFFELE